MIKLVKTRDTQKVEEIVIKHFRGGHYCNNFEVIKEVKDGVYRFRNIIKGNGTMKFYIIYVEAKAVLIAPLFTRKNLATVAGTSEGFDFVDFFYSDEALDKEIEIALSFLFDQLKHEGIRELRWNWMPDDTISNVILEKSYREKSNIEIVENTIIPFNDYDSYKSGLSKNTKQNLRTAQNRLNRDNKKYEFHISLAECIDNEQIKDCLKLYYDRQKTKYGVSFLHQLAIKTLDFNTRLLIKRKGVLANFLIDGEVAAFMFGYINQRNHSLEIPKLAINEKFGFYSPGMLLVDNTVKYLANNTSIKNLDLCRGTEQYKLKMGGKIYPTYKYIVKI